MVFVAPHSTIQELMQVVLSDVGLITVLLITGAVMPIMVYIKTTGPTKPIIVILLSDI